MPGDQLTAERAQLPEERHAGRQGQARKVNFEEFGVAFAILW